MLAGVNAVAAGLSADELHGFVLDEVSEHADGVGATADAGNDNVWERAGLLQHLGLRLNGDDLVELAHDRGEWVRAGGSAEEVVGIVEGGCPVTQRLIHRVLEGAGTGIHADDLSAHEAHAVHVGGLALHVLGAHVDHAVQVHERARQGGGGAVLTSACLRDDAGLAHLLGQQCLTNYLVGLMGATMHEVLAL